MIGFVFDHLWQSTLFAVPAGLLTVALRGNAARIRYYVWFAASVKFLIPFAALTAAGSFLLAAVIPPVPAPNLVLLRPVTQPFSTATWTISATPAPALNWAPILTTLLLAVWGIGCVAILARWALRWSRLQRVKRQAVDCSLPAPVPVKMAPSLLEPGLVGIWRPVILLPQGIAERLSRVEMDAILAHEICHLRRRDNLLAATHMMVEALFWFHPLVWWLGARLNAEREHACDESVLAQGLSPQIYAESILKVCEFYLHSPLDCAAGISGADLKTRMETIMENKFSRRLSAAKKLMLAGAAALAIAVPLATGLVVAPPVLAQPFGATPLDPRSEAALRGQIEGWEKHQPAFAALASDEDAVADAKITGRVQMGGALVDRTRQLQAEYQQKFDALGALKSITFRGVDETKRPADVYVADFANAQEIVSISLTPAGKIFSMHFIRRTNPDGPEPGTEAALRQFMNGLPDGQSAYDLLTPRWANALRSGFGANLQQLLQPLGTLKSLTFQKVTVDGLDQYEAAYEHGRASWSAGALIGGKMVNFYVRIPDSQRPGAFRALSVGDDSINVP